MLHYIIGIFCVLKGTTMLLRRYYDIEIPILKAFIPILLILFGLALIFDKPHVVCRTNRTAYEL